MGIRVSKKTVYKIMKMNNLTLERHVHKHTTINLKEADGPCQVVETDITYLPTRKGMTYLISFKDVFTKKWLGYNYSRSMTANDVIESMDDVAVREYDGKIPDSLIVRTDNGSQYISRKFNDVLNIYKIGHEYIERETPKENGDIESFHNSIKTDYIWVNEIEDYEEGKKLIENAFYDYNNVRPHSTIDYYPPNKFIEKYNNDPEYREYYKQYLHKLKENYRKRNNYKKVVINV